MKKLLYLLALVMLASCHSSKKANKDADNVTAPTNTVPATAVIPSTKVPDRKLSATEKLLMGVDTVSFANYTAKVKVQLKQGSKDIATTGQLKMRWNDVIQISLVDPVLGIAEVGRLEFSKDNVLIVDRINRQYVQESYASISALAKTDISYEYIQAFFWAESQKPNNDNISYKIPLKQPVTLTLKLDNVGHKDGWDAHYVVSNKYNKVTAEQLFNSLSGK